MANKKISESKQKQLTVQELNQNFENYQKATNAKIGAILISFGDFNRDFVSLIETLKSTLAQQVGKATLSASSPPRPQPAISTSVLPGEAQPSSGDNTEHLGKGLLPGLEPEPEQPPSAEPSKQDRLLAWANILAKLAESGKTTSPEASVPESLGQLSSTMKLLGGLRSIFLDEMKSMIQFTKSLAPNLPTKLEDQHKLEA